MLSSSVVKPGGGGAGETYSPAERKDKEVCLYLGFLEEKQGPMRNQNIKTSITTTKNKQNLVLDRENPL